MGPLSNTNSMSVAGKQVLMPVMISMTQAPLNYFGKLVFTVRQVQGALLISQHEGMSYSLNVTFRIKDF